MPSEAVPTPDQLEDLVYNITVNDDMVPDSKWTRHQIKRIGCWPEWHATENEQLMHCMKWEGSMPSDEVPTPYQLDDLVYNITVNDDMVPGSKWTRRQLKRLGCWPAWHATENEQLMHCTKWGGGPCHLMRCPLQINWRI
jgi:sulfur carrier protein ThiS